MKLILSCTVVLIVILTGISAQAQEPLALYDNFQSKYLDPDKWWAYDFGYSFISGSEILEYVRQIKVEPINNYRGLCLLNRSYGGTTSDNGISLLQNRVYFFTNGENITTIQAKVQVNKVQVTGCTTNPTRTSALTTIGGYWFNTGTPTPGSTVNDVWADISLVRPSNSSSPSNVLDVVGYVIHCYDEGCLTNSFIGTKNLGTVHLGQKVKLRITWDQANHRFIYQKGSSPEQYFYYDPVTYPDISPPGSDFGGSKGLDVRQFVANCTSQPRQVGFTETYFDDIYVNQSAAP